MPYEILCWGSNQYGQLGLGASRVDVDEHVPVTLDLERVEKVTVGGGHSFAFCADGVYAWGNNSHAQLGLDEGAPKLVSEPRLAERLRGALTLAAGFNHTLALANGEVIAFGAESHGQVLQEKVLRSHLPPCKDIAAGVRHSLAVSVNGEVFAWGDNAFGQCGANAESSIPQQVPLPCRAVAASAGLRFSAVLDEQGRIWTFGNNKLGELGRETDSQRFNPPGSVQMRERIRQISSGWYHMAVVTESSRLVCWGKDVNGQVGGGRELTGVDSVCCGSEHTAALLEGGRSLVFGWNEHGQLGHHGNRETTEMMHPNTRRTFTTIACGGSHNLGISPKDSVPR
mmetsp:Transcript_5699/g.24079  ORF Transcript_5699/g.24079 Transcript_5699/m.24079 type:complete len:341 (-) Transcript_5699:346-1368(-)|eukprot:CAMPEP_0113964144 /NCGR_PEP_ID=MMETSP0011_2-20120614/6947_1 /TAXON_ID=101924 /ORGANISM="Rhodosorus marinus" /LENGTH=340 /DNA_ID=CAMNT_0000976355 /DNA_START=375 /DNA_END=1397 /DNA_ORIENTATION=- /assembly_acc=CAM_ASM_000156